MPSQETQVTFSFPPPLMFPSVTVPSTSTMAGHCPISTPVVWGHPFPFSSLHPVSSLASALPTQGSLSLSLASEPIRAMLVHRIWRGQFVEMLDLMGDNIALNQHFEGVSGYFPAHVLPASSRPHLHEGISLPSWIYFLTYLVVGTSDQSVRDRLIYALLIVHYLQHDGRGWLDYDHLFRQQAALNPSLAWNSLHSSLVASTILGQRSGGGTFCTICQGVDHLPSQCSMAYLHQPTGVDVPRGHGWLGPPCLLVLE